MGASAPDPPETCAIRTPFLITAALIALSAGVAWGVAAHWPGPPIELTLLSPLALDDPEPTLRPRLLSTAPEPPTASPRPTSVLARASGAGEPPVDLLSQAHAGDAKAQLQLARLYETGAAGLRRDLAQARLWTRRAAGGGDAVAMYNLGFFLMEGEGGPRDLVEGVAWFRRAAERGVVDAQFNLGLLYEAGHGVAKDAGEAYRWFVIAGRAGDVDAQHKQLELAPGLALADRASVERAAAGFRPMEARSADEALIISPATTVAETQTLLARKGYYIGPMDGVESPAVLKAAVAYLRDHPAAAAASVN